MYVLNIILYIRYTDKKLLLSTMYMRAYDCRSSLQLISSTISLRYDGFSLVLGIRLMEHTSLSFSINILLMCCNS